MVDMIGDALAAVFNPTSEQLDRREAWLSRHPAAALALMTAPGWAIPLLAMAGWLS